MKAKKIKKIFLIILIFNIFISCGLKDRESNKEKIKKEYSSEDIFKDLPLEKVSERFNIISKKNKIKLKKFERLNYDGKFFYYSEVDNNERTSYTIEYIGIDVRGLFLKVNSINAENIVTVENFIINLIEVSDARIKKEEAQSIYEELLENMKQDELLSSMNYKNGMVYGLKIDNQKGEFIFFIQ